MRALILVLGLTAIAPLPVPAAENCGDLPTQSEINRCADKAYAEADAKLNVIYRQITSRLRSEEFQKTLKALITAQRAWIAFRDAECAFVGSDSVGGKRKSAGCFFLPCRTHEQARRRLETVSQMPGGGFELSGAGTVAWLPRKVSALILVLGLMSALGY